MDVFETLVMQYVTRRPHVFISPQYSIDDEWSCPDFVALDFKAKVFSVVEVSSAYRPAMLINKVREREKQWLERLRSQLERNGVVDSSWRARVEVFIRHDARLEFDRKVGTHENVVVRSLEDIGYPWLWDWTKE
jgi:hypothetical protein